MHLLEADKVQSCPFKGTATMTACCTSKGTILAHYFMTIYLHMDSI